MVLRKTAAQIKHMRREPSGREAGIRPSSEAWPERPGVEETQPKPTAGEAEAKSTGSPDAESGK